MGYINRAKNHTYFEGDLIYLFTPKVKSGLKKKLSKLSTGPYWGIKRFGPVTVEIRNLQNPRIMKQFTPVEYRR